MLKSFRPSNERLNSVKISSFVSSVSSVLPSTVYNITFNVGLQNWVMTLKPLSHICRLEYILV